MTLLTVCADRDCDIRRGHIHDPTGAVVCTACLSELPACRTHGCLGGAP